MLAHSSASLSSSILEKTGWILQGTFIPLWISYILSYFKQEIPRISRLWCAFYPLPIISHLKSCKLFFRTALSGFVLPLGYLPGIFAIPWNCLLRHPHLQSCHFSEQPSCAVLFMGKPLSLSLSHLHSITLKLVSTLEIGWLLDSCFCFHWKDSDSLPLCT